MADGAAQPANTAAAAAAPATAAQNGSGKSACPPHVLEAIYGKKQNKKEEYERSLQRWWTEYADRKNDEEDEYVANSLLYDRNHLPRTAPAPDCVRQAAAVAAAAQQTQEPVLQQQQPLAEQAPVQPSA